MWLVVLGVKLSAAFTYQRIASQQVLSSVCLVLFFPRAFSSLLCVLFHAWKECSRKITGVHSLLRYREAGNGSLEMCHVNLLAEKTNLWKKFNLITSCCIPFISWWKAGFKFFVEIFCYRNSHLQATCSRDLSITESEPEDMQVQNIDLNQPLCSCSHQIKKSPINKSLNMYPVLRSWKYSSNYYVLNWEYWQTREAILGGYTTHLLALLGIYQER